MNRDEARAVARSALSELRAKKRGEVRDDLLERPPSYEVVAGSGTRYGVEVEALRDDGAAGDLRVYAAVDDGSWRASVAPLTEAFIVARHGFIGE
jgi:carbon monoxide dehydrogenase subunit G